ncbi:MAG: EscU/YscU/HrcU family type III secretion system export apparatus switch protein [Treponema sp.]|uniref:EscU/YscU/HrcU family type III secretion system export apparatus switch protein n=1 Tax=Treponema sp. TaxID=166 RepID=UPI001D98AD41|nr:EscU/YscU/HrcU family type III secretion system export apparatus switch protein [Treponema sp.]MBS7240862.1 EscU/YscU/HrcU family type III secretion system export apparatus switch protein [Treponema sp.]
MKNNLLAVSLKYPENVDAPLITAKTSGIFAKKMVEIARENGIPVVVDDILANVLSVHQIGECIPEATWEAVASVFSMISFLEKNREEYRKEGD